MEVCPCKSKGNKLKCPQQWDGCKGYLKDQLVVLVQALEVGQNSLQHVFRALAWRLLLDLLHQQVGKVILQSKTRSNAARIVLKMVVTNARVHTAFFTYGCTLVNQQSFSKRDKLIPANFIT